MTEIKVTMNDNLKRKPLDEETLGFGKVYTDHMFEMDYSNEEGWHNGRIVPYKPLELDPAAMCFHYGQTVFEGLKAYRTDSNSILLFRPWENFKRMNRSCDRLCIPRIDEELALKAVKTLVEVEKEWVPKGKDTSLYIRPFIIATEPYLGVSPSKTYKFFMILSPSGQYYANGLEPVRIYVETEYVRAVKGGMGMAKTGGNYAAGLKSQLEACKDNYDQTLWLDGVEKKYVEEVGSMNIFFVLENEVVTPQLNGSILEGITRKSVIELLKEEGYKVIEKKITIEEIVKAYDDGRLKEVFGTGTAAVISPVGELKWGEKVMKINHGEIGRLSQYIYDEITAIQWGRSEKFPEWTLEIRKSKS